MQHRKIGKIWLASDGFEGVKSRVFSLDCLAVEQKVKQEAFDEANELSVPSFGGLIQWRSENGTRRRGRIDDAYIFVVVREGGIGGRYEKSTRGTDELTAFGQSAPKRSRRKRMCRRSREKYGE